MLALQGSQDVDYVGHTVGVAELALQVALRLSEEWDRVSRNSHLTWDLWFPPGLVMYRYNFLGLVIVVLCQSEY